MTPDEIASRWGQRQLTQLEQQDYQLIQVSVRLSDDDINRIAIAVVRLLKETP